VSHANAALTPRARLRLARLIVDQGWPVVRAAERYDVSWPTAKRWSDRYRQLGAAGMGDASSRPRRSPNKAPQPVVRKIVHLRWKQRLGPVQIADRVGLAPSTVHRILVRCRINRLTHVDRTTGEPIRRYEHDHPGSLIHVDVKKLGNVPDGGGWRFVGRQQGKRNRAATPDWPTPRSTTTKPPPPRQVCSPGRRPGSPTAASPSSGCCPTTARPTAATYGATPAPSSASAPHALAPTGHKPTEKSSDSIAPWPTDGHSRSSTTPNQPAEPLCQDGSTSTTTTGPTPRSADQHPPAA
jgi:transposase-like protein